MDNQESEKMPVQVASALNDLLGRSAYDYAWSMVPRADHTMKGAPLWYGWALREAFVAGARWQKDEVIRSLTQHA